MSDLHWHSCLSEAPTRKALVFAWVKTRQSDGEPIKNGKIYYSKGRINCQADKKSPHKVFTGWHDSLIVGWFEIPEIDPDIVDQFRDRVETPNCSCAACTALQRSRLEAKCDDLMAEIKRLRGE